MQIGDSVIVVFYCSYRELTIHRGFAGFAETKIDRCVMLCGELSAIHGNGIFAIIEAVGEGEANHVSVQITEFVGGFVEVDVVLLRKIEIGQVGFGAVVVGTLQQQLFVDIPTYCKTLILADANFVAGGK